MSTSLQCSSPLRKRLRSKHDDPNDNAAVTSSPVTEVDEKLYSRQLYVMGHAAQRRMMSSSCLLIGLSGVGVEVAKNIILAGISSLTLLDPEKPSSFDLGGNFYLSEENLSCGKSRAEICADKLAELNQYVKVHVASISSLSLSPDLLSLVEGKSCVVVSVPLPTKVLYALDQKCRSSACCFIYTHAHSVFGSIFCDFGVDFEISDKDGENPHTSQVEHIIPENPPVVKVLEDHGRHGLESGDFVRFDRLKGLNDFIEDKEYEVNVTGPYTFELVGCDFSAAKDPASQGYITQVKKPVKMSFRSLKDCMETVNEEDFMMVDFAKMERPMVLHIAFTALALYAEQHGGLPSPGDKAAALEVCKLAKNIDKKQALSEKDEGLILHLASGAKSILSPMCAALGGFAAQEVLKACSGKFTPIKQFLYMDAAECLPDTLLPMSEVSPTGSSMYDSQVAVFGISLQEKICALRYFLVGAGAIGCEMLKNWSLMGVGCGPSGHVHVTDMDRIEKSNLSRQFLFRNKHIDHFKSSTAAEAAKTINPKLNITALQEKVGKETENIFGDDFYANLSGVCTALDNVEARLYVDQRCLFYRLPMLESGTLGTKGNTQIVVPHLTENYGATRDPPEKSIPVCTLKNFPNQIQHTLQWARDYFEGVFKQCAEDVNSYLDGNDITNANLNQKIETIRSIRRTLADERPSDFEDCVKWARLLFEQLFDNQIRQLLFNFPEDQVTSTGSQFWSGSKRCPKAITFDPDVLCAEAQMRNHFDFVIAASNLRAQMYGIPGSTDELYIREVLSNIIVPDFTPKDGVKIAANAAEAEAANNSIDDDEDTEFDDILSQLPKPAETKVRLHPIEFDKDIDEHMLFVTACSNLRALNYSIPTEDTHRSRAIAGRIIPAIATTTALVAGLICLELYKVVGTARKELTLDAFKNGFLNLGIPFITLSEPTPPAKTKTILNGKEWEWTAWDSFDMLDQGDITLKEYMQFFETKYNMEVNMISTGVSIIYSFFANKKKIAERMTMKMSEVVKSVTKKEFPENQLFIIFEIIANDKTTDEEIEIPYVKFKFR